MRVVYMSSVFSLGFCARIVSHVHTKDAVFTNFLKANVKLFLQISFVAVILYTFVVDILFTTCSETFMH